MYRLTQEQQDIVARARDVAEKVLRPQAERIDAEGVFPREAVTALGEAGILGMTVPREFGGLGQGLRTACAVLDELAQRCASTAMVFNMHLCGVACYAAAPKAAGEQLRDVARGRHLTTLAFSERGSRSHFWAPVSRERAEGGRSVISAEKSWVTSAGEADGYVVSTQWASGKSPIESMLYLILQGDLGLAVDGPWSGLGMRGNSSSPMRLEGVVVGPERALSPPGKGLDIMLGVVLPVFQLGQAAIARGIAEAAVDATCAHLTSKKFEHLGTSLADLPTLRARLAQMRIETDRAHAHIVCTLDSLEQPGPMTQLLVLETKAAATEAAATVTEAGMRACGGAAFSRHLGLERNFRDARASVVMAPTTDQVHEFIGRALCGMELFA